MTDQNTTGKNISIETREVTTIRPLYNVLLFPKMVIPMEVTGLNSIRLIDDPMIKNGIIGIIMAKKEPLISDKQCQQAHIKILEDTEVKNIETEDLMATMLVILDRILKLSPFLPPEFRPSAKSISDPGVLADIIISNINAPPEEKQRILNIVNPTERLRELTRLVNHQMEVL
jgi:ATP-dependent Lon protease